MPLTLDSPITSIDPKIAARRTGSRTRGDEAWLVLENAFGITSVGQLIHHYPRRYIDRSRVSAISELPIGKYVTVIAHVKKIAKRLTRRHQTMVVVTLYDGTGYLDLTFFNQPWAAGMYKEGTEVAVSGVGTLYKGRRQLANQEVEVLGGEDAELVHTGRITPVHPASEGITTRTIRELVWRAIDRLPALADPVPGAIVAAEQLGSYDWALRHIHFPEDQGQLHRAQERLKFDELFTLELGVAFRKHRVAAEAAGVAHEAEGELTRRLIATVPFEPTGAQLRAMAAVGGFMASPHPMNVLLQGDVGSGKTLVAVHAALVAIQSGHQAAIMAPTEVLAGQHVRSVAMLLEGVGAEPYLEGLAVRAGRDDAQTSLLDPDPPARDRAEPSMTYAVLTGAVTGKDRLRTLEGVAAGDVDLVIGTHALVQEGVTFADLTLAVIDEQHRFGLHQRLQGIGPGECPLPSSPKPRAPRPDGRVPRRAG